MSLRHQEDVLLDLLFDQALRERFRANPRAALAPYPLSEDEYLDFATIPPDALALDAAVRTDLILSQLCRHFPLSFSLLSALPGGLAALPELLDPELARTPAAERATRFGLRLPTALEALTAGIPAPTAEALRQVVDAEVHMAWTADSLRNHLLENRAPPISTQPLPPDWEALPIRPAAFVSISPLPGSYPALKAALCPCTGAELWHRLRQSPVSGALSDPALTPEHPRLLVARATLASRSRCDPTVEHATADLPSGFIPLFEHVDGTTSVLEIQTELAAAGATEDILCQVRAGFLQLLGCGMLELC